MMKLTVDRIVEGFAVVEKEDLSHENISLSFLPEGTKEGSVLIFDGSTYTLDADGGSIQIMVYYSDSWTAELTGADTNWIVLSRTSASGQSYLRITYDSAVSVDRTAYITFYPAHGEPVDLKLTQKAK